MPTDKPKGLKVPQVEREMTTLRLRIPGSLATALELCAQDNSTDPNHVATFALEKALKNELERVKSGERPAPAQRGRRATGAGQQGPA